jgi:heme-degrading monooxygenase HmoA
MMEIATFRLADGVAEAAFLEADALVQARFAPRQRGFLRRTTARGDDGSWAVVVLWGSEEDALAAAAAAAGDRWVTALLELVDPASVSVRRYTELA